MQTFNSLNRKAVLHNINIICPTLAQTLINTYQAPVRALVTGSGEIASIEGITQWDPLAMAMYALAITPLIDQLRKSCPEVNQAWYAEDATGASTCRGLRLWRNKLMDCGPSLDTIPMQPRHLVVKQE